VPQPPVAERRLQPHLRAAARLLQRAREALRPRLADRLAARVMTPGQAEDAFRRVAM